jgi:hypothetical protein
MIELQFGAADEGVVTGRFSAVGKAREWLTARDWNGKGSAKRALEFYLLQAA